MVNDGLITNNEQHDTKCLYTEKHKPGKIPDGIWTHDPDAAAAAAAADDDDDDDEDDDDDDDDDDDGGGGDARMRQPLLLETAKVSAQGSIYGSGLESHRAFKCASHYLAV